MSSTEGVAAGVELEGLQRYFSEHIADAQPDRPLRAELISGGRSNLTYVIADGEHEWVLRRPPLGHVLPTAHDMGREFRVISALAQTNVPVPRALGFCEDESVTGAPFYVMEKVDGVVLRDLDAVASLNLGEAARCSRQLLEVLARIHSVDYEAVGLGDFGHPDGYLERQVRRWGEQWERSKTRELGGIDELARRLRAALPDSGPPAIVHGDYRIDNTMLAADDPGTIVAVLDWEMATLGDPLADLGLFVLYWAEVDVQELATDDMIASLPGFLNVDEVIDLYAAESGRSAESLDFYVALAAYKLAIIVEGIHARFLSGQTVGEGFEEMGARVPRLVEGALERASASSIVALRGE